MPRFTLSLLAVLLVTSWHAMSDGVRAQSESDFYRIVSITTSQAATESRSKSWKPAPNSLPLEISGMAWLRDGIMAVSVRKGEVWFLGNIDQDPPSDVTYHRFASSLHEPLGLLEQEGGLLVMQRTELTRLLDHDKDQLCDEYETVASGWGVSGNYHEYAFGPKQDREGNLWFTLNLGLGIKGEQTRFTLTNRQLDVAQPLWRGWGMMVTPQGELQPMCAGMRSPSGIGSNLQGEMFYTDQQGNWVATNSLHHLRRGVFYHHPEALASIDQPGSPIEPLSEIPNGLPYPEALQQVKSMRPPAVWLPYKKVGQSATDIVVDASDGKFGPFAGQLFVGEFTLSSINRVFLEEVDGEYQGACFPFRSGFASAVLRLIQGGDGSLYAGLSNRGWSSLGSAAYGLQRLVWTGKTPMEIREMRAQSDGFELVFTKPVDKELASRPDSYEFTSHTYRYHSQYGSDEILEKTLTVEQATVSDDGFRVRLRVTPLRPYFVHSLTATKLRSDDGEPLLHPVAYYTLNRIPKTNPSPSSP